MMNRIYTMLLIVPLLVSCTRAGSGRSMSTSKASMPEKSMAEVINVTVPQEKKNVKQTVHVFIENSGSMNGYINEASDFQMAIGRAIVLMDTKGEYFSDIKVYYVNSAIKERVCGEDNDLYNFVQKMLERNEFTTSGTGKADPGTQATDLNEIVKLILDYVDEENTAILISDCIYSLNSNKGVTTSLLFDCQNLTMKAFLNKVKPFPKNVSLATNFIQFESNFRGKYWTWKEPTGDKFKSLKCPRPYYMCVIGTDENVQIFNQRVRTEELVGYKNQYTISNKDVSNSNYTVLDAKYRIGQFRHNKDNAIHELKRVTKTSVGRFGFAIAIDLSQFTMSESDKCDKNNYVIESENYKIETIEAIDTTSLSPLDRKLVRENHCTHLIALNCEGFPTDLRMSVKRSVPRWIKESSSTDDTSIDSCEDEQKKTFGIEYFVNGIFDAYMDIAKDKENFMTIFVKILN